MSKNAFLLLTAAAMCSPRVYAGGCDNGCRSGSSFLQARCVYDLIRRNKCPKQECCHVVEVKPAPHPVCSDCKNDCCKSSRWSRLFGKKCDSCPQPKKCDCYVQPKKCDCCVQKKCDCYVQPKKCDCYVEKKCDCHVVKPKCDCYVQPKKCDCCAPKQKCDTCCKRGWFARMGDWLMEEPGCGRRKKSCGCGCDATFYTPSVVTEPAKAGPGKAGPEVLPKAPSEVPPKKN